MSSTVPESCS
ncbi:hypothetical protein LINPERPRIM_LOCUS9399 [Linum perenne]